MCTECHQSNSILSDLVLVNKTEDCSLVYEHAMDSCQDSLRGKTIKNGLRRDSYHTCLLYRIRPDEFVFFGFKAGPDDFCPVSGICGKCKNQYKNSDIINMT